VVGELCKTRATVYRYRGLKIDDGITVQSPLLSGHTRAELPATYLGSLQSTVYLVLDKSQSCDRGTKLEAKFNAAQTGSSCYTLAVVLHLKRSSRLIFVASRGRPDVSHHVHAGCILASLTPRT
jgi:hypothetical protein